MKALTVCQPYAHLIASGEKPIENRTYPTHHRGALAIHAGKARDWMTDGDEERYRPLVFGAIVAVAQLVACLNICHAWPEQYADLQHHEHANGPYCWVLEDIRKLRRPIYCRGAQGLWIPFDETQRAIREAVN